MAAGGMTEGLPLRCAVLIVRGDVGAAAADVVVVPAVARESTADVADLVQPAKMAAHFAAGTVGRAYVPLCLCVLGSLASDGRADAALMQEAGLAVAS